jgi:hypothetical protein
VEAIRRVLGSERIPQKVAKLVSSVSGIHVIGRKDEIRMSKDLRVERLEGGGGDMRIQGGGEYLERFHLCFIWIFANLR